MMNETLQKELGKHFKKIDENEKSLDEFKDSLGKEDSLSKEFEEEIKAEITRKIKEYLDKENFDYENGRNNSGARIIFKDGRLKIREFKHHSFYELNVLDSKELNDFLPDGLIKVREIINEKIKEIEGVILEFKGQIKLKKGIPIQIIDNRKVEKKIIKDIEISFNCEEEHSYQNRHHLSYYGERTYKSRDREFKIKLNDSSYDVDDCLYSDEVFNNILILIEKFKKHIQKVKDKKDKMKKDLRDFVFNRIDSLILIEELK